MIEALSARCPAATTAVGWPARSAIRALGTLVPTEDVNALAHAIVRTVTAPPDTTRAQQLMLDRYGIDRLAMDSDLLYRGILAKKGKW